MSSLISASKRAENYALAEENYKKATKKAGTTLLRWKPDWEQAARYYREAVKYYKLSGEEHSRETVLALKESAVAHKEIQSYHTAAADLEAAAQIERDYSKDPRAASELYTESALLYRSQGSSHDKAAAMLVKAAECLTEIDVPKGVELMKQACSIFEEEGRAIFHDATFKKAISWCIAQKKFGSARSLLARQITLAQQHMDTFETDVYRNALSIVLLRFHTEDYEKAAEELQKFEDTLPKFSRTDYGQLAAQLVRAWEDGDAELFNATVKNNTIKYLLNPIAVLARKLQMPEDVASAAAKPNKSAGASASSSSAAAAAPKKSRGKKIDLDELEDEEIDLR